MAIYWISQEGEVIVKTEFRFLETQMKDTFTELWSISKSFPLDEFKALFFQWVICNDITLQKSVSHYPKDMFALLDSSTLKVFPTLHNTIKQSITS